MHSDPQGYTVCDVCGFSRALIRHTARTYGKGKNLLVIEDVPVVSCPNCGTNYLTASTLKVIDRIKRDRKTMAVLQSVEVASFSISP